ncbi:MAG: LptF/LptG family permease [Pseudomonadota bacterium]
MTLLSRYLFKNNLLIILAILAVGITIYLLVDLFDNLDIMIDAGISFQTGLLYYAAKTPLIISQILPAIFLLAALTQLSIMSKERELVAIQAGGISMLVIVRFFIINGILWSCLQLAFSQAIGVYGENEASRIWQEEIRGRAPSQLVLEQVWFTDDNYVIHLDKVAPRTGQGQNLSAYNLSQDGVSITEIIRAKHFTVKKGAWLLEDVSIFTPENFGQEARDVYTLALNQDVADFAIIAPKAKPNTLPLWQLGQAIEKLSASGSNVEGLRTAWHMKVAYAASLLVMGLIAVAIITWRDSIYLAITLALACTFVFYVIFTVGGTLGEKGLVSPFFAAWGANILAGGLAIMRLIYVLRPRRLQS